VLKYLMATRGSLVKYIRSLEKSNRSVLEAAPLVHQIITGLECVHGHGYAHLDLYHDNILVTDEGNAVVAKIADFGMAKLLTDVTRSPCGGYIHSKGYECVNSGNVNHDKKKLDEFSIGILTYFMLTGSYFMAAERVNNNAWSFKICPNSNDKYTHLDIKAKDFIGRLAFHDPAGRMSLDMALVHPFITHPDADAKMSDDLLDAFAADPKHVYPTGVQPQPWKGDLAWFNTGIQHYAANDANLSKYCAIQLTPASSGGDGGGAIVAGGDDGDRPYENEAN